MEIKDRIVVRTNFSENPGARYRDDGPFSGQQFLEDLLEPRFIKAKDGQYLLEIDLDGVWGYPSSFVSGSFGKLSLKYTSQTVRKYLTFKSDESKLRLDRILDEIDRPKKYEK